MKFDELYEELISEDIVGEDKFMSLLETFNEDVSELMKLIQQTQVDINRAGISSRHIDLDTALLKAIKIYDDKTFDGYTVKSALADLEYYGQRG